MFTAGKLSIIAVICNKSAFDMSKVLCSRTFWPGLSKSESRQYVNDAAHCTFPELN